MAKSALLPAVVQRRARAGRGELAPLARQRRGQRGRRAPGGRDASRSSTPAVSLVVATGRVRGRRLPRACGSRRRGRPAPVETDEERAELAIAEHRVRRHRDGGPARLRRVPHLPARVPPEGKRASRRGSSASCSSIERGRRVPRRDRHAGAAPPAQGGDDPRRRRWWSRRSSRCSRRATADASASIAIAFTDRGRRGGRPHRVRQPAAARRSRAPARPRVRPLRDPLPARVVRRRADPGRAARRARPAAAASSCSRSSSASPGSPTSAACGPATSGVRTAPAPALPSAPTRAGPRAVRRPPRPARDPGNAAAAVKARSRRRPRLQLTAVDLELRPIVADELAGLQAHRRVRLRLPPRRTPRAARGLGRRGARPDGRGLRRRRDRRHRSQLLARADAARRRDRPRRRRELDLGPADPPAPRHPPPDDGVPARGGRAARRARVDPHRVGRRDLRPVRLRRRDPRCSRSSCAAARSRSPTPVTRGPAAHGRARGEREARARAVRAGPRARATARCRGPPVWWAGEWAAEGLSEEPLRRGLRARRSRRGLRGLRRRRRRGPTASRDKTVAVHDLVAATPEAEAALWQYLCDIDLTQTRSRTGPSRRTSSCRGGCATAARCARRRSRDWLWLRPVDVPALLGARRYATAERLVLEVRDEMRPDGGAAGRFLLDGGPDGGRRARGPTPRRTSCSTSARSARSSLGGLAASTLARAGPDRGASTPGALRRRRPHVRRRASARSPSPGSESPALSTGQPGGSGVPTPQACVRLVWGLRRGRARARSRRDRGSRTADVAGARRRARPSRAAPGPSDPGLAVRRLARAPGPVRRSSPRWPRARLASTATCRRCPATALCDYRAAIVADLRAAPAAGARARVLRQLVHRRACATPPAALLDDRLTRRGATATSTTSRAVLTVAARHGHHRRLGDRAAGATTRRPRPTTRGASRPRSRELAATDCSHLHVVDTGRRAHRPARAVRADAAVPPRRARRSASTVASSCAPPTASTSTATARSDPLGGLRRLLRRRAAASARRSADAAATCVRTLRATAPSAPAARSRP